MADQIWVKVGKYEHKLPQSKFTCKGYAYDGNNLKEKELAALFEAGNPDVRKAATAPKKETSES